MNAPVRIPNQPTPAGDNNPPADPTPFDLSEQEIEGLFVEGRNWLDGSAIQSQDEADAVGKLLALTKAAIALADERRAIEVKPLNDAKDAIQDRYNQLIGKSKSVTGRAQLLKSGLEAVLTPWNEARKQERNEIARAAREVADRKAREAALALQMSDNADLGGREDAEALNREARAADAIARKAERPVATGLRTHVRAEVTDPRAFARWAWGHRQHELFGLLQTLAERLSHAKVRDLPGVTYHEEAVAR